MSDSFEKEPKFIKEKLLYRLTAAQTQIENAKDADLEEGEKSIKMALKLSQNFAELDKGIAHD